MQDSRVIPVLFDLDLKDLTGPLSQFQAKKTNIEAVRDIVSSINKVSQNPADGALCNKLVDNLWHVLEQKLGDIQSSTVRKGGPRQEEVLEQLVETVRSLDIRLRDGAPSSLRDPENGKGRASQSPIVKDLAGRFSRNGEIYVGLLMLAGMSESDFPWLADVIRFIHAGLDSGDREKFEKAEKTLRVLSDSLNSPEISMQLLSQTSKGARSVLSHLAPAIKDYLGIVELIGFTD